MWHVKCDCGRESNEGSDYMLPDVNDIYLNQYLDSLDERDEDEDDEE